MHRRFGNTAFFRVARRITSSLFVVVYHYENVLKMLLARAKNLRARVCNSYERKVAIHHLGSERLKLEDKSHLLSLADVFL